MLPKGDTIIVGEYELAIDELEYVLSIPSWCSPEYLKADPLYAPLYDNPRFQAMIQEYEKNLEI